MHENKEKRPLTALCFCLWVVRVDGVIHHILNIQTNYPVRTNVHKYDTLYLFLQIYYSNMVKICRKH